MNQIKQDHRQLGTPTLRCCLCTVGIGNTKYGKSWFRHFYREPYFYIYKHVEYILDEDCYKRVLENPRKLEESYNEKATNNI